MTFLSNFHFFKVYCCSKKTHCDRYRIYYKTDDDTIQVQINSPEGLAWPGTEFETEAELIKPFPDYHHADQFFSKYVTIHWRFFIWLRFDSTTEAIGYPQRLKALWVNYDDADLIFTEIRFKLSDESSSILTASGYIKKDRFKVLLKCQNQKFNWI